jgi:hypothetical protein
MVTTIDDGQMSRRWLIAACVATGLALIGLAVWGAVADLDAADKFASVVGGIVGVLSLAFGVIQAGRGPTSGGQSVSDSTVHGGVAQVRRVQGSVRVGPAGATTPPAVMPAPTPGTPNPAPTSPPSAPEGQTVTGSHVAGPIYQIDDVGGDVEVER